MPSISSSPVPALAKWPIVKNKWGLTCTELRICNVASTAVAYVFKGRGTNMQLFALAELANTELDESTENIK